MRDGCVQGICVIERGGKSNKGEVFATGQNRSKGRLRQKRKEMGKNFLEFKVLQKDV